MEQQHLIVKLTLMKRYRKFLVILFVGGFGILSGLEISDYLSEKSTQAIIKALMYFSLMLVMLYEWIKILRKEKTSN